MALHRLGSAAVLLAAIRLSSATSTWVSSAEATTAVSDDTVSLLQVGGQVWWRSADLGAKQPVIAEAYWPSGRGRVGLYGTSRSLTAPAELNSQNLAWSWHHPLGRFHTLTYGTAIDAGGNIYLSAADAIRKFTPGGQLLWEHSTLPAEMPNAASLLGGAVYSSDTHGNVFALSMETGETIWKTKVCGEIAQDNGFVTAHEGVVMAATDGHQGEKNLFVRAFNATHGAQLWAFKPDVNVWNFMASFPGDGTTVFQDQAGKGYRLRLSDGSLLWKAGGQAATWTDGTATLGSNRVLYTVHNNIPDALDPKLPNAQGTLEARRLEDGSLVWSRVTPRPPNNAPAVGRLYGSKDRLSVVQPVGQQVVKGAPTDVHAYDAETGEPRWVFRGPAQKGSLQAGDLEGMEVRQQSGVRPICLPNPWSAPTIDARGTVFIGNEDGLFFALRDLNGDGVVEGPGEVSAYDTQAAFSGSAGPALAPGVVAVASCDTLFVFKA